jgi:hypothetical protein
MSVPDQDKRLQDIVDLLSESAQDYVSYVDENGDVKQKLQIDPEKLYWGTRIVNSPFFGRFVLVLKRLEQKGHECKNNMSLPRAINMAEDIIEMVKGHKYSIDGKSSESIRDKNNTQGTLLHLLARQKIEKEFVMKDGKTKGFLSGMVGDKERDEA